jgi:DNA polymerase I-like protein with 3'-5' exonuclease and polymerase domains
MDLRKAKRESAFPELRRPPRFIHLRPTIEDLETFWQDFIEPSSALSMDIETKGTMITCVGIAPSPSRAIIVPFFDEERSDGNYWRTTREERIAWKFIERCLNTPGKRVFGHNFSYDAQYLWGKMGIPLTQWTDDTMLMHHALQIEMKKSLGFLASIYSDELAWKFMVKHRIAGREGKKEDL